MESKSQQRQNNILKTPSQQNNQNSQENILRTSKKMLFETPKQNNYGKKAQRTQSCSPSLKTHNDLSNYPSKQQTTPLLNSNNSKLFQIHNIDIDIIYEKKSNSKISPKKSDIQKKKGGQGMFVGGGGKEKQKNLKLKLTQLKDIKPLNLEEQKQLFFQKLGTYNPQFLYLNQDLQFTIQKPHTKHIESALKILNYVIQEYGSEEQLEELEGGEKLTQQETSIYFENYIKELNYQDLVSFEFQENTVAPTSCIHSNQEGTSKVVISLPIRYRKNRIMGVLNHEIGTHIIRKYNDKFQKWHKKRKKYEIQDYSKIEEGLACLNQHFELAQNPNIKPIIYKAALLYYASALSAQMSFSELFKALEKHQKSSEERWKTCVRVKRGIQDTASSQGQYKDQIYFRGVIKVLKNRNRLNFINLHSGKITAKDCLRLTEMGVVNSKDIKIPYFLLDQTKYLYSLNRIAEVNFLN